MEKKISKSLKGFKKIPSWEEEGRKTDFSTSVFSFRESNLMG